MNAESAGNSKELTDTDNGDVQHDQDRPLLSSKPQSPITATQITHDSNNNKTSIATAPFEIRLVVLLLVGLFVLSIVSSLVLHVPIISGRRLLVTLGFTAETDVFSYPAGFSIIWAGAFLAHCILKDVTTNMNLETIVKSVVKWTQVVVKLGIVACLWMGLPPMLVGLFVNAFFIVPLRTPLVETPQYAFGQMWIVGLILLKIWMRCVLSGVFGDIPLRFQMEQILIRGFAQFDAIMAVQRIVLPVLIPLLDFTIVPYFFARLCCLGLDSYLLRTCVVRFSLHAYVLLRVLAWMVARWYTYFATLHSEIRDSRYLIGTKLINRNDA